MTDGELLHALTMENKKLRARVRELEGYAERICSNMNDWYDKYNALREAVVDDKLKRLFSLVENTEGDNKDVPK